LTEGAWHCGDCIVAMPGRAQSCAYSACSATARELVRRLAMGLLGVVPLVLSAPAASARDVREALRACVRTLKH
jgi:hypothetical protein